MEKQPLIKQGWLRVLVFIVALAVILSFLFLNSGALLNALNIRENPTGDVKSRLEKFMMISLFISILPSLIIVFIYRKFVDKRSLVSLGLEWKAYQSHAATGFFLAIILLGTGSFLLIANKNLEWTNIAFDGNLFFINFGFMMLVAFSEELVFRGYVLINLMESMNKWVALLLSALLFTIFHINNPGITAIASLNLFLSGLLLGINYIYTKNLWFSILFHFNWNFFQGPILGYKVSGWNLQSIIEQELTGNPLLTGGDFGFEGSIINGTLVIITLLILAWIYERKFSMKPTTSMVYASSEHS